MGTTELTFSLVEKDDGLGQNGVSEKQPALHLPYAWFFNIRLPLAVYTLLKE